MFIFRLMMWLVLLLCVVSISIGVVLCLLMCSLW